MNLPEIKAILQAMLKGTGPAKTTPGPSRYGADLDTVHQALQEIWADTPQEYSQHEQDQIPVSDELELMLADLMKRY